MFEFPRRNKHSCKNLLFYIDISSFLTPQDLQNDSFAPQADSTAAAVAAGAAAAEQLNKVCMFQAARTLVKYNGKRIFCGLNAASNVRIP